MRRFGFSACRSELPYVYLSVPCSSSVSKYVLHVLGVVQTFVPVFISPFLICCWELCRSFRRAAAAGDELEEDVTDRLLTVLNAGNHYFLITTVRRSFLLCQVLR